MEQSRVFKLLFKYRRDLLPCMVGAATLAIENHGKNWRRGRRGRRKHEQDRKHDNQGEEFSHGVILFSAAIKFTQKYVRLREGRRSCREAQKLQRWQRMPENAALWDVRCGPENSGPDSRSSLPVRPWRPY